jgi:glutaredoxin
MKIANHRASLTLRIASICLCAGALLPTGPAAAQTVYRSVGPDGKVTFSDQPPAASANVTDATGKTSGSANVGGVALPLELRQAASKFPVVLYTADNCAPCGSGRALLVHRGIPFTERTVNTPEDAATLQRISGESSLPFLTIGSQQINGYSDLEWADFFSAAGYPEKSALPAGYRNPAATPLVTMQKPAPAAKADLAQPQAPTLPSAPAGHDPANPAGIRF